MSSIATPCIHRPWTSTTVSFKSVPVPSAKSPSDLRVRETSHVRFGEMRHVADCVRHPAACFEPKSIERAVEQRKPPRYVVRHFASRAIERVENESVRNDYDAHVVVRACNRLESSHAALTKLRCALAARHD